MISHAQKSDKIVKKIDNIIKVNNYKNIADKIIRILKNIKKMNKMYPLEDGYGS